MDKNDDDKDPRPVPLSRQGRAVKDRLDRLKQTRQLLKAVTADDFQMVNGVVKNAIKTLHTKKALEEEEERAGTAFQNPTYDQIASSHLTKRQAARAEERHRQAHIHILDYLCDREHGVRGMVTLDRDNRLQLRVGLPVPPDVTAARLEPEKDGGRLDAPNFDGDPDLRIASDRDRSQLSAEGVWLNHPFVREVMEYCRHEGWLVKNGPKKMQISIGPPPTVLREYKASDATARKLVNRVGGDGTVKTFTPGKLHDSDDMMLVLADCEGTQKLADSPVGRILSEILQRPEGKQGLIAVDSQALAAYPQLESLLTPENGKHRAIASQIIAEREAGTGDRMGMIVAKETAQAFREKLASHGKISLKVNKANKVPVLRIEIDGLSPENRQELQTALGILYPGKVSKAEDGREIIFVEGSKPVPSTDREWLARNASYVLKQQFPLFSTSSRVRGDTR